MIASFYAGMLALGFIALSVHIIRGRWKFRIALGDEDNHEMKRRIRAQANFVEYTLFFLLLLTFAEHNGLGPWALHLFGLSFTAGRAMHAYSLLYHERYENGILLAYPLWRTGGMICSLTGITLLAIICITQYLR